MISRRSFLLSACTLTLGSTVAATLAKSGLIDTTLDLQLKINEIKIQHLPDAFSGFKIGVISDIHLNTCSSEELLIKAVNLLKPQNIDLLILAGDYVLMIDQLSTRFAYNKLQDYKIPDTCNMSMPDFKQMQEQGEYLFKKTADLVSELNPRFGIMATLGNHDRWNSAENCLDIFNRSGFKTLVNESEIITINDDKLEFYGTDDYGTGIPQSPPTDKKHSRIVISHNPDFLAELKPKSYDLGLAGHTHGGQLVLPCMPAMAYNVRNNELIQGLSYEFGSPILTSAGIGTSGLPIRINCPPEVNLITLIT